MTKLAKLAAAVLLAGGLTASALAVTIEGQIQIGLFGATVNVNQATDDVTFSAGPNAIVNNATGDYAPLFGDAATYSDFNYGALVPGTVWMVDATTYFVLESITAFEETVNGGVTVLGLGTAFLTGFEQTPGAWSFSADRALSTSDFTFSSTTTVPPPSVPDGGTTAALLGLGLVGLSFVARRRRA